MAAPASRAVHRPVWRVLLVDDSQDDAELAEWALRKGGLEVECRRACTAAELVRALSALAPEGGVADANLPGSSGAQALALSGAPYAAMPVAFVTGGPAPGERPPQADGLLLKDDLDALAPLLARLMAGVEGRG